MSFYMLVLLCVFSVFLILMSATIKSKERFEPVGLASTNIATPDANQALKEAENDTCIPVLTAAQTIPLITEEMPIKMGALKAFNKSPNHCFVYKPNDDFVCSKENPDLYTTTWEKASQEKVRLGDSFRDTVQDIREAEVAEPNRFATKPGCVIKFDPYSRPEEINEYVQYLGTRNEFMKDTNAKLAKLGNTNEALSSKVYSLSANVGSMETKLAYEAAQNQGKNEAIKAMGDKMSGISKQVAGDTATIAAMREEARRSSHAQSFDPQENAIRAEAKEKCLTTYGTTSVELQNCSPSFAAQQWSYDDALHLRNKENNKCLSGANSMATYKPCADMASQQWMYDNKKRLRYLLDPTKCLDYETVPMKMTNCGASTYQTFQVV